MANRFFSVVACAILVPATALAQPASGGSGKNAAAHPDLSGVYQADARARTGTWEEANQGIGVPEPASLPARQDDRQSRWCSKGPGGVVWHAVHAEVGVPPAASTSSDERSMAGVSNTFQCVTVSR